VGAISDFTKIRRYPKVKVTVPTKPAINEKNFRQEVFFPFFGDTISVYTHMLTFYLLFTLRCRQADFVASISLPVSLTLAINYCRCRCYRR